MSRPTLAEHIVTSMSRSTGGLPRPAPASPASEKSAAVPMTCPPALRSAPAPAPLSGCISRSSAIEGVPRASATATRSGSRSSGCHEEKCCSCSCLPRSAARSQAEDEALQPWRTPAQGRGPAAARGRRATQDRSSGGDASGGYVLASAGGGRGKGRPAVILCCCSLRARVRVRVGSVAGTCKEQSLDSLAGRVSLEQGS